MSYWRIKPGHPAYERVKALKDRGLYACDAVTHNNNEGCSNPACFKYKGKK